MREYKFRGKRVDNGEWVYGYYFKTPLTDEATNSKPEDGWYFLTGRERHCISKNNCVYEVEHKTVGEYTGPKDKNGKEIYEADIVQVDDFMAVIEWDVETCRFVINVHAEHLLYDFDNFYSKELEVIGTIHDNPELLQCES